MTAREKPCNIQNWRTTWGWIGPEAGAVQIHASDRSSDSKASATGSEEAGFWPVTSLPSTPGQSHQATA